MKAFNRPGHGTSFGKQHISEGYLQSKDLQLGSFLNFLSSVSGCLKCTPKVAFSPGRKAILLCAFERPPKTAQKALSFRTVLS
jgi:hypothetical protein